TSNFNPMETNFEAQLASNDSIITYPANFLSGDSSTFINSTTSSTDFISEEVYRKQNHG
ncbi:unnamed protein product, partial [Rotaria socialis]